MYRGRDRESVYSNSWRKLKKLTGNYAILSTFLGEIYHKDMHHGTQSSLELENFFANLTHYNNKVYSVSSFHMVHWRV